MIDCLSNPEWIKPQIDFLLFLQSLRIGHFEMFDKFFLSITIFGEFWLPTLICAITYWCVDFRAGLYLFSMESFNIFLAHFFKMIACVYRPWVLDSRIHPSELAVPFAKGYSFPSGHTAMSSSILGGIAYLVKKNIKLCLFLIALVLLVGFSRLWLGVHTPQDVAGGLVIGISLIFLISKIINWAEKNKNRYMYLLFTVNFLVVLAAIYITFFNTYRIDYVSGEILVNPQSTIHVTLVVYAFALGLINGCFLCRRFFPFNPKEASIKRRILRGFLGTILTVALLKCILENIVMHVWHINTMTALCLMFLAGITITLVYPIIFKKLKI